MTPADEPKLIIDTDWKAQAQAEKQRLEQQAAAKAAKSTPGPAAGAAPGGAAAAGGRESEQLGFEDLAGLLASQALSYMGYFPDPRTGQAVVSLEYARLHIDLLEVLESKTKGNLTPEEQAMMTRTLSELRLAYVELAKAVEKAVAEGRVRPVGGQAGVGGLGAAGGAAPTPKIDLGGST
ncbi:MAG TPA: DUF1844 domain-containing protein [Phycisphaerales bacterium]|nr:DUF1844 domain-containing protein [Phycisphaerales bacterium]